MAGLASRPAVSAAQETSGARIIAEAARTTRRQEQWLKATPEQRVGLAESLGEDGARALAKKNRYEVIYDGLDRTLPQGPDQVYRAADGRIIVYEAKGGSSSLGRAYGYEQGTPEWAVESAKRVLESAKAGTAEKTAASEILTAAAERRLTVEVVRTKHRLGEPFAAVVEQSLNTTDDAARLAKAALDSIVRAVATALDDAARASGQVIDDRGQRLGKIAKTAPRTKAGRLAGKALLPLGLVVDGTYRVTDATAVEEQFAGGRITQQEREIEHAKNGAGFVGGWGGAWAGAEVGAATGGAIGTAIVPGPGTAIGAVVGGTVGGVTGYFAGEAAAAKAAEWTVHKIHRTGTTLQYGWNWTFGD